MPVSTGIVGLPNSGKSTLFNALTHSFAEASPYPFCTISPNIGHSQVKDKRLDRLHQISGLPEKTYATVRFIDIAGLVRNAHQGEGLGNQFLSHIREVDAIVHVIRGFYDILIPHPEGDINPLRDAETVDTELILADLQTIEKHLQKIKPKARVDKKYADEASFLEKIICQLSQEKEIREVELEDREELLDRICLLTQKKKIYVVNVDEKNINERYSDLDEYVAQKGSKIIYLCAKLEDELTQIDDEEREIYLKEMNLEESRLDTLIKTCYEMLDLITFFTISGEKEARAWAIKKGTTAYQAAGKIHKDIKEGFIKAEVINYEELIKIGDMHKAREKGAIRIEGKDYIVADGDIINFKFR